MYPQSNSLSYHGPHCMYHHLPYAGHVAHMAATKPDWSVGGLTQKEMMFRSIKETTWSGISSLHNISIAARFYAMSWSSKIIRVSTPSNTFNAFHGSFALHHIEIPFFVERDISSNSRRSSRYLSASMATVDVPQDIYLHRWQQCLRQLISCHQPMRLNLQ